MRHSITETPLFMDVACVNGEKVLVEIQKRAGNKSVLYVHVGSQTIFRLSRVQNENLETKIPCIGCQLTLDFHSGRQWTDEDVANWEKYTGKKEATNRILCDTIRELMK